MRKLLLTATALVGFAAIGSAGAADMPVKAPPMVPVVAPLYDWTGFYAGVNIGDMRADSNAGFTFRDGGTGGIPGTNFSGSTVIGGVQGGYNYQIGHLVIGTELDFSWPNASASATVIGVDTAGNGYAFTRSQKLEWLDTLRGRLGYTPFDRLLLYATGGVAYGLVTGTSSLNLTNGVEYNGSISDARAGWTAGAGVEYAITGDWSVRLEYLYYDLGGALAIGFRTPANTNQTESHFDLTGQIVRVGLDYRTNWGSPIGNAPVPMRAVTWPGAASTNWTGFYVGGHVGGAVGTNNFSDPFGPSIFGDKVATPGYLAGGQIGLNYQVGSVVFGVEGDASWTNADGTNTCFASSGFFTSANCHVHSDAVASLAARFGFAVGRSLFYAKGGIAWQDDEIDITANHSLASNAFRSTSTSQGIWGWTWGGGVEYALTLAWSAKVEYDHLDFGSRSVASPYTVSVAVAQGVDQVKLGVNYKFGADPTWPAGAVLSSVVSSAMPVKAMPVTMPMPLAAGWEVEFGPRYWHSAGRFQKDLANATLNIPDHLNSRLTYDGMTTNAGELFGRVDTPWGIFVKGFAGVGHSGNGHLNDEDWGVTSGGIGIPYSNTLSNLNDGNLDYATIDAGYDVFRGVGYKVGGFVGYNYFATQMNARGCVAQIGDTQSLDCAKPIPDSIASVSETDHWQSVRVGISADLMLFDRLKFSADVAYLPYVYLSTVDNHWLANGIFGGPGHGDGVQLESLLSYNVTDRFSVGVGGRYWSWRTTDGGSQNQNGTTGTTGEVIQQRYTATQYGVFLQGAYRLGWMDPVAQPANTGIAPVFKAPPIVGGAASWTGAYTGLSVGARWSETAWTTTCLRDPCSSGEAFRELGPVVFDSSSLRVGSYSGYNWQFAHTWVAGLEGDIAWGSSTKTVDDAWFGRATMPPGDPASVKEGWDGSIRARVGHLVTPAWMIYAAGGGAWQNVELSATCVNGGNWCTAGSKSESFSTIKPGWTVGTGIEGIVGHDWLVRVEYRYADYGHVDHTFFASTPTDSITMSEEIRTHTVLAGLAHKFTALSSQ